MKRKSTNIIAFDIGSHKIAALAANVDKQGNIRDVSHIIRSSKGVCRGIITDLRTLEESFLSCIYDLESQIDRSITEISVAISCPTVKSLFVKYSIKLSGQLVTKNDVKKLIQKALSTFKAPHLDIIHYFPIEFILDKENVVENPIGLYASEITCQLHIIAANATTVLNLTKCLARCQVKVKRIASAVYVGGMAVLNEDEKTLGAIVIDFGSHTTSFAVFYNNNCVFVGNVPIGSANITTDIARTFGVGLSTAEKLKVLHGTASSKMLYKNEVLRLENYESSANHETDTSITSEALAKVIENRLDEIASKVKMQYDSLFIDTVIAHKIVITGGGANLHGISHFLGKKFDKQVRLGKSDMISKLFGNNHVTEYASALGLVRIETNKDPKGINALLGQDSGLLQRLLSWI